MQFADLRARRIAGFGLTSRDAVRLTAFYQRAFCARLVSSERLAGALFERWMGVRGGALRHCLQLGDETLDILQFDEPGRAYPRPLFPPDSVFQHFALIVSDMDAAMGHLRRVPGWKPISIGGPQRLPQRSGGVAAFKFQDPDGHPLELLAFPEHAVPPHWRQRAAYGTFLGVDHSAISVRDTAISTAYYQSLGFAVTAQSCNHGVEQANLDGVPNPQVEVTALSIAASTPHLELLCYRSEIHASRNDLASNDVAATRIALAVSVGVDGDTEADTAQGENRSGVAVDPDGHHLLLVHEPAAQCALTRGELC